MALHKNQTISLSISGVTSEGNGIGLTLVRRIVELCEGEISLESEEGRGSIFTVTLPIAETIAEAADATVAAL